MDSNRHKLLLAGLLAFFLGVQFRVVDSVTLNERSTHFVSARLEATSRPWPGSRHRCGR